VVESFAYLDEYHVGFSGLVTSYDSVVRLYSMGANVDYSLYLVTDSTPAILGDADLKDVVDKACQGGVTIVQYREKLKDTAELVATGRKLHTVTQRYGVPLLINDRVDVALAVGCEGVHIGQDDLGGFILTTRLRIDGSSFND